MLVEEGGGQELVEVGNAWEALPGHYMLMLRLRLGLRVGLKLRVGLRVRVELRVGQRRR